MKRFVRSGAHVGLALSGLVLAYALVSLGFALFGPDCFEASETLATVINSTPLVLFAAIVSAFVLDLRALRAGGSAARVGRWAVSLLIVAVVVIGWAFVDSLGDLLACAEGD
jgi:hypothetical protein